MNTTKLFLGTNKLSWLLFIFICSNFILISCSKETYEPEKYQITIENNYFESVSVTIESYFSEKISSNAISTSFFLPKGSYVITCTTPSFLQLKSTIFLQGEQERITLEITSKGKIVVK
ncbi:MAG: hypothetical protein Q4C98_04935 [Capnocytophaga sp.]|nr:hypothetical protein [Capnocytophaga sp.]